MAQNAAWLEEREVDCWDFLTTSHPIPKKSTIVRPYKNVGFHCNVKVGSSLLQL
jgi:hypothetical protein